MCITIRGVCVYNKKGSVCVRAGERKSVTGYVVYSRCVKDTSRLGVRERSWQTYADVLELR